VRSATFVQNQNSSKATTIPESQKRKALQELPTPPSKQSRLSKEHSNEKNTTEIIQNSLLNDSKLEKEDIHSVILPKKRRIASEIEVKGCPEMCMLAHICAFCGENHSLQVCEFAHQWKVCIKHNRGEVKNN
jgi:hypothetical protein